MEINYGLINRFNLGHHECLGTITDRTIQIVYQTWTEIKSYPIIFKCICGNLEPTGNDFLNLCIAINEGMPPYDYNDIWIAISWMIDKRIEYISKFYFQIYYNVGVDGTWQLCIDQNKYLEIRYKFFNDNYCFDANLGIFISIYIDIIQAHQDWNTIGWPDEILLLCEEYTLADNQYALKQKLGINNTRLLDRKSVV